MKNIIGGKTNQEFDELIGGEDILRVQEVGIAGTCESMPKERMPLRTLDGKMHGVRKQEQSRKKWVQKVEDGVCGQMLGENVRQRRVEIKKGFHVAESLNIL